jgi:HSP20 family molecular chaperone IbpA
MASLLLSLCVSTSEIEEGRSGPRANRAGRSHEGRIDAWAPKDEKVNATFKDGVLMIKLPKTTEAKGTTIPVKSA